MHQPTVLVTGASGFIGSHVAESLCKWGYRVRWGFCRPISDFRADIDWVACNLDLPFQIEAALQGVDLVVHAAYGDERAMARQAQNLLKAMSSKGLISLLAFSSIAVYGRRTGLVTENDEPLQITEHYARSKLHCEALYRIWAAENRQRRVIALRPGIVYGRGSTLWIENLARRILSGSWGDFGELSEGRAALIHIEDLAEQCLAAIRLLLKEDRVGLAAVEFMNCVGPQCPSWNEYFQALAQELGLAPLRRWSRLELLLRQIVAAPMRAANRLGLPIARGFALPPSRGELALFALHVEISGDKARRLLGYVPHIGLTDGLVSSHLERIKQRH